MHEPMNTIVITPQIVNKQLFVTLPDNLNEQDFEIKIIFSHKKYYNSSTLVPSYNSNTRLDKMKDYKLYQCNITGQID